jgi:hypothetical protein
LPAVDGQRSGERAGAHGMNYSRQGHTGGDEAKPNATHATLSR